MPLNLEDKKALVAEVNAVAAKAQSVVAAEYRGLTVTQMTDLRAKARAQGVYMRVVKNTLARKALAGTAFETIGPVLKGALVLAFSKDEPAHTSLGDLDADGSHEGAHSEVRRHARRAAAETGTYARRHPRPETGRSGRLMSGGNAGL